MTRTKSLFTLLTIVVLIQSCGSSSDRFRMEGQFKNMNQVDLYLYDAASGKKDTVHVQRGRFLYETTLEDTATFIMMFPNFSQIPIFASSGITVKVKGDASQLRETNVKGSKENDEMTAFRLKSTQLTPPEMKKIAAQYIKEEPNSPVSFYLLQQYFIKSMDPDYKQASQLCNLMIQANPHNKAVQQLYKDLTMLKRGSVGNKIPNFILLDTKDKIVTRKNLSSKVNVICLWATWNYDSRSQMKIIRTLIKEHQKDLCALGISIDASEQEGRDWLRRDSINFPLICDGKMWETPMAVSLGMTKLPCNIITDQHGRITHQNISTKELKKTIEDLLDKEKGKKSKKI